jgi:hypothetical protein
MEFLLLGIGAAVVAVVGARRLRGSRDRHHEQVADLDAARRVAEEDVICFGEDLQHFGARHPAHDLDPVAAEELRTALAAYESAEAHVDSMQSTDDISRVVDTLAEGRFALACSKARTDGVEVPTRRTPCYFNPQHGPAVEDVRWTRPGWGTRVVPACAQDAARARAGEHIDVRKVAVGGIRVPYWEAGELLLPYVKGYFPATPRDIRLDATAVYFAPFDVPLPQADDQFKKWSP